MNGNRRVIDMPSPIERGQVQPEPRTRKRLDDHHIQKPIVAFRGGSDLHPRTAVPTIAGQYQSHGTRVNLAPIDPNHKIGLRDGAQSRPGFQGQTTERGPKCLARRLTDSTIKPLRPKLASLRK